MRTPRPASWGIEVGLIGVDGTGKSSIASELSRTGAPVKLVYMGRRNFHASLMRVFHRRVFGASLWRIGMHLDFLCRRTTGWLLARQGFIVIYDRHPTEYYEPDTSAFKNKVSNLFNALYNWPLDLNFYLVGDYSVLYRRKPEWPISELMAMDQKLAKTLQVKNIAHTVINVTHTPLALVLRQITSRITAKCGYRFDSHPEPSPQRTAAQN